MAQEAQAEPSMEEILASIRRIISEEDQPEMKPVLELTQPAEDKAPPPEDDIMVFEEEKPAAPAPQAAPEPVAAAPVAPAPQPAPAAPRPAPAPAPIAMEQEDAIISERVAAVTANAFTKLASNMRVADMAGQTLEGMIRQLIQPMLKEWLDANLPAIVEAKVEAELERIARLAR